MVNVAVKAARAAGAIINRAALDVEAVRISQKQVNDFVTDVDKAAEAAIIETLLTAYPDHGIWAEETGREHGAQNAELVWIIDPLDGTTNFIHGLPVYCVSIALAYKGKVEQAVIYDPSRNDLFTATKGRGAYLNDRRLRVSKRIRMEDCLISTGFPFRPGDDFPTYLQMMTELMPRKYPEYVHMMQGVRMSDMACFRVEPQVISVLDYRKGFGHTDLVTVAPSGLAA